MSKWFLPSEQQSIALWGLGGLVIFAGVRAFTIHMEHQTNTNSLGVEVEHLHDLKGGVYQLLTLIREHTRSSKLLKERFEHIVTEFDQFALFYSNVLADEKETTVDMVREQRDKVKGLIEEFKTLEPLDAAVLRIWQDILKCLNEWTLECFVHSRKPS